MNNEDGNQIQLQTNDKLLFCTIKANPELTFVGATGPEVVVGVAPSAGVVPDIPFHTAADTPTCNTGFSDITIARAVGMGTSNWVACEITGADYTGGTIIVDLEVLSV